jgi:predicted NUDIX family phosphoesterase
MRRGDVEEDESWLQVIPYMYIYNKESDKVFVYTRSVKSGEKRLHGQRSLGIGGHINETDCFAGTLALLGNAAYRELLEEVSFEPPMPVDGPDMTPEAVILLDETTVDRVHLGVIIRVDYTGKVSPNGDEVEDYFWADVEHLDDLKMEKWSNAVAEFLQKKRQ